MGSVDHLGVPDIVDRHQDDAAITVPHRLVEELPQVLGAQRRLHLGHRVEQAAPEEHRGGVGEFVHVLAQ